jgi:hypothetical protein
VRWTVSRPVGGVWVAPGQDRLQRYGAQMPLAAGSRLAIEIGAATHAVIGLVALTLPSRPLPLLLGNIMVSAASVAIAIGAAGTEPTRTAFSTSTHGPGASVTLLGAGLGVLAVLLLFVRWIRAARPSRVRVVANPLQRISPSV